jgi:hypothetical protein
MLENFPFHIVSIVVLTCYHTKGTAIPGWAHAGQEERVSRTALMTLFKGTHVIKQA